MKKRNTNVVVRIVGKYSKKVEKNFKELFYKNSNIAYYFNEFFRVFKNFKSPQVRDAYWIDCAKKLITMIIRGKVQYKKVDKEALLKVLRNCGISYTEDEVSGESLVQHLEVLDITIRSYLDALFDLASFHAFDPRSPVYQAKKKRDKKKKPEAVGREYSIQDLKNPSNFQSWFAGNLDRKAREEGWSKEKVSAAIKELNSVHW